MFCTILCVIPRRGLPGRGGFSHSYRRVLEIIFVALLTSSVAVWLPNAVPCRNLNAATFIYDSTGCMDPKYQNQLVDGIVTQEFLFSKLNGTDFMARYKANRSSVLTDPRVHIVPFLNPNAKEHTFLDKDDISDISIVMKSASQHTCGKGKFNGLAMLLLKPGTTAVTNMFLRCAFGLEPRDSFLNFETASSEPYHISHSPLSSNSAAPPTYFRSGLYCYFLCIISFWRPSRPAFLHRPGLSFL